MEINRNIESYINEEISLKKEFTIAELYQLIDLAEKIANNKNVLVGELKTNLIKSIGAATMIAVFALACRFYLYMTSYSWNNESLIIFSLLLFIGLIFYLVKQWRKKEKIKEELKSEEKRLIKLLNMIDGYRSMIREELNPIQKDIVDMRLSRINFSV